MTTKFLDNKAHGLNTGESSTSTSRQLTSPADGTYRRNEQRNHNYINNLRKTGKCASRHLTSLADGTYRRNNQSRHSNRLEAPLTKPQPDFYFGPLSSVLTHF